MVFCACPPALSSIELETPSKCIGGSGVGRSDAPILSLPPEPTDPSSDELTCIGLGGLVASPSTVFGASAIDTLDVADEAVCIATDVGVLIAGGTYFTLTVVLVPALVATVAIVGDLPYSKPAW